MNQDRWIIVNKIFHAALEVEPDKRHALVVSQSGGDPEVEAEVELLLSADEQVGTYLDTPLDLAAYFPLHASVSVGDVLCNRFRIVRKIAEGGMGQVFEAFDTELAVRIALKVISPSMAFNPDALSRFRHEVRLARSITHPNICRTFDLERDTLPEGEVVFLTMEFLAGETLASRLQREGALSVDDALAITRQIASGLEAAHALGIVHRDMKPANIMLVPTENHRGIASRAVITDFGLARLDPLSLARVVHQDGYSTFSQTGRPIGTFGYMAPEQLEGTPVSPATDLYAFALILFEMRTGERLFKSSDLLTGIAQRLKEPMPSIEAPLLTPEWRSAIEAGLRYKPADRPQTASEMLDIVDGKRLASPLRLPFRRLSGRIAAFATFILIVAVALFFAGLRFMSWKADSKVAPGALIYLAEVQNLTEEKPLDATTELLRASLAQSAHVNLLDQGRIGDILQQMQKNPETHPDGPIGREIAMRVGAARVVFATLSGSKGNYHLDIDLQQPDNTPARYRRHWTNSFSWRTSGAPISGSDSIPSELLSSLRDASDWIRNQAGESAHDIATLDTPPEDVTTSNWQALAEYTLGQKLIVQDKKDEAIAAFQRAIKADSGFSLAYAHMGDVLVAMNRQEEGYQAYLNALNSDSGQRLSRKERDFIQGSYASDTRDYATAVTAFRDYSAFYPNDFNAWFYQAFPLEMLDRPQEAIQAAMRADALTLQTHNAAGEVALGYLVLGDHASARKWIEIVHQAGRQDQAVYLQAPNQFLSGQYVEAERSYEQLQRSASKSWRRFGFAGATRVRAEQQDYDGAMDTLTREENEMGSILSPAEKAALVLDRAYSLCRTNRMDRCVEEVDRAIEADSSPDTILRAVNTLGSAISHMSSRSARRALAELRKMDGLLTVQSSAVIDQLARQLVRGEIDLAEGHFRQALVNFRKAESLDAPLRPRDYMGRCLLALATHEKDPATSAQLQEEALAAYGRVALRPVIVWRRMIDYPPGFVADEMLDFVAVARLLHRTDEREREVEALLLRIRSPGVVNPPRSLHKLPSQEQFH